MDRTTLAGLVIARLKEQYPDAVCSLEYDDPLHLLIATRLSAQCTDERVNKVTPALFAAYPTARDLAEAPVERVEGYIKSCGLYKTKARDIVAMCGVLTQAYGGRVPDTLEALTALPGVGRKTANLVLGDAYGKPSYVCDTHCIRVTNLLGLTEGKDPYKVEMQLRALIPPEESGAFCHRTVLFGREFCVARRPRCGGCPLADLCPSRKAE